MLLFKKESEDDYQYWVLPFFIAYGTLTLFFNFDRGRNLSFVIQILLLCVAYDRSELFRTVFKYKLNIVCLLLALYHWLNMGIQGVPYSYNYIDEFIPLFYNFFLLIWTCYLALKDTKRTLLYMFVGYLIFISLAALNAMSSSGYNFSSIGEEERLSGSIHTTQMGAMSGLTVFIAALLHHYSKYSLQKIIPILVIPLMIVIMAASRNGLLLAIVGLFCLFFSDLFTLNKGKKNYFTLLLLLIPVLIIIFYLLQETYVGERLLGTKEQSESEGGELDYKTGTILDYLGDRTWYYVLGFSNFLEHPIFGIGFNNFRNYNEVPFIVHPEYMLQLSEGGLVAVLLFFFFVLSILFYLLKFFFRARNEISFILLTFFLMTIVNCLSTSLSRGFQYWPLLGLCVAVIMKNELRIHYITEETILGLVLRLYVVNKIKNSLDKARTFFMKS